MYQTYPYITSTRKEKHKTENTQAHRSIAIQRLEKFVENYGVKTPPTTQHYLTQSLRAVTLRTF